MTTPAPAAKRPSASAPATPAASAASGGSLDVLVKRMESIQIGSVGELNEFLDNVRALAHWLAVHTVLAAGDTKASMTAAAKSNSKLNVPGFNTRVAINRVVKKMELAAEDFAGASAAAVAAWTTFTKEFDDILQNSPASANKAKRVFDFNS